MAISPNAAAARLEPLGQFFGERAGENFISGLAGLDPGCTAPSQRNHRSSILPLWGGLPIKRGGLQPERRYQDTPC
jgi:hypothetical protein